jgi:transcription termination factor NusB
MFRLEKKKIFLLYRYYLFGNTCAVFKGEAEPSNGEKKELRDWFETILTREIELKSNVSANLNPSWEFVDIPPLEKAILIFGANEILFLADPEDFPRIVDQIINFSRSYLEENKFKYINKNLDMIFKGEF